jgi:cytochrome c oxidase subunit 4
MAQSSDSHSSHASGASHGAHGGTSLRTYYLVYAALLVLLLATVGVGMLHLGSFGLLVALTIAFVKAILVVLYFMHLRESTKLTWTFAAAGFVWLLILMVLMMSDYLTRGWVRQ